MRNYSENKKEFSKIIGDTYDLFSISRLAGFGDYTDGIYYNDKSTNYIDAQRNQFKWISDMLGISKDFRLLDIGCGNGNLLEFAEIEYSARSYGITLSREQVDYCRSKKLNVSLNNYRNLPGSWKNCFDGIVANGSLEHFCSAEDALNGNQNDIYKEMFEIFSELLDSNSESKKVVTTSIHFSDNKINPRKFLRNPIMNLFDSKHFHFSILNRGYGGGFYPFKGQLEECAEGIFEMINEVDGTEDYRFTSEDWKKFLKRNLFHSNEFLFSLTKNLLSKPLKTVYAAASFIGPESWLWQFKGKNPPTRLYRHVWRKK